MKLTIAVMIFSAFILANECWAVSMSLHSKITNMGCNTYNNQCSFQSVATPPGDCQYNLFLIDLSTNQGAKGALSVISLAIALDKSVDIVYDLDASNKTCQALAVNMYANQ